jgi:hypothetical protein
VNPYGIVTVPSSTGSLVRGDILISNFNDSENLQGTGTTIVQVSPAGKLSLFAQIKATTVPGECPGGVGLTTALAILPGGYVVVGSLPTSNGNAATAQAGCVIVLNSAGHVVKTTRAARSTVHGTSRPSQRPPTADILTANASDGNIVETTPFGAEFQPFETEAGGGGLFGLTVAPNQRGVYFVNDTENTLDLLH